MPFRRTIAVAVLALLAGCNDDGRALAPAPEVPDVPLTTSTTAPPTDVTAGFALSSPIVPDGGTLPAEFTCDGLNVPPELTVTGAPANTAELALALVDVDADDYVHWVVAGLPPTTSRIDAATSPRDTVTARADSDVLGWDGPCPPPGDAPHRYRFTVYASPEPIGLAPDLDGRTAIGIIDAAAVESADFTVFYGRTDDAG